MQTFIEIFLCMFAIYGVYSLIIGICAFLSGKARVVYSVRAESGTLARDISAAASVALSSRSGECEPVILCESVEMAESVLGQGLDVYIRYE